MKEYLLERDYISEADVKAAREALADSAQEYFGRNEAHAGAPSDSAARKALPLFSGVMNYFPDALLDVARLSRAGNDKHNPGEPLHWAREKSTDHPDCCARHLLDYDKMTTEGAPDNPQRFLHATALAWRSLALLQTEIERLRSEGVAYPPLAGKDTP